MHVHAQQPVITNVFVPFGCRPLIPHTFTYGNFRFLRSSRLGVTCPLKSDAVGSVLFGRGGTEARGSPQTQQGLSISS
jgi:hypothetical protein